MNYVKKPLFGLLLATLGFADLHAANWLSLQGTQPEIVAPKGVKVPYRRKTPVLWGFIQENYKKDQGTVAHNGTNQTTTPFSLLNPDLNGQEGFNSFRVRLALRGMADRDNKVNYFFMTETANNGINNIAGHREAATYFTDASITLKHIPGIKMRMGMFKTPGSEEGLQAVFVSPYIEFTNFSYQQLLERQISAVGAELPANKSGGASTDHYNGNPTGPIAAFRDTGLQLFDTFALGKDWELSYAYMVGNGSGISLSSSNVNLTNYVYTSLEKLFHKGRGYFTESFKAFAWYQNGNRRILVNSVTPQDYTRIRSGVGMTYYHKGIRFEAEYMDAAGMIFEGAKDTDTTSNAVQDWTFQYAVDKVNTASGYYVNLEYEILPKQWEVYGRYDYMDRMKNDTKAERLFNTTILGTSYRFKGATRVDFNYIIRKATAPGNSSAQTVLDNMGNRIAVQLTAHF